MAEADMTQPITEPMIEDNYGLYLLKSIVIIAVIILLSAIITYIIA